MSKSVKRTYKTAACGGDHCCQAKIEILGSAARLYRYAGASGMMTGVLTEIDPNYYSPLALLIRVNNNVELSMTHV